MPIPSTTIRTSHAISIKAGNQVIGNIQSWSPSQSRAVTPVHEIDAVGVGLPFEQSPGVATGLTIQIARYDLYVSKMEEIWGTSKPFWMLTDQHNPIDVEEKWIRIIREDEPKTPLDEKWGSPAGWKKKMNENIVQKAVKGIHGWVDVKDDYEGLVVGDEYFVEKFWYSGCWFSQLGRSYQAQGDRIVMANATLSYARMRKL